MSSINIKIINQLNDNYSYIFYSKNGNACIIDPAESIPIIEYVNNNNLKISDIFITHHHSDHTSGVIGIKKKFPEVNIHSPSSNIENTRFVLKNNDEIESSINSFKIISTPGHTLDHIIYHDKYNKILFSGDTLFRLGCGRVFEGSLNQMYASLQRINELDDDTYIYCGHEYTLSNLNFIENIISKKNLYLDIRLKIERELELSNKSVPFRLDDEKKYNLFLNQESLIAKVVKKDLNIDSFELFKYLREKKDKF